MKKSLLILPLLLAAGVYLGYELVQNEVVQIPVDIPVKGTILEDIMTFLAFEPREVRSLREREYPDAEEGHVEYYYQLLEEDEQKAYREMLESFRGWEGEFYLTISEDEKIDRVYHAVLNDHPEVFWVRNRHPVYKTLYMGERYSSFTPYYEYGAKGSDTPWESEEVQAIYDCMQNALNEIDTMVSPDDSDYDKAFTAYTWLVDATEYQESDDDQSIAGVFWKGEAVCAGYAAAYQYLLEHLGVFCIYVEGESAGAEEGHAWNIVRLDGDYYYVDPTNGDQPEFLSGDAASLAEHKTILMDYLCPFPWEYEQLYTPADMFPMPACTRDDMNFYVRNNGCLEYYDEELLQDYFHMRIDNGAAVVRFKFRRQEDYEQAVEQWGRSRGLEESLQYYMQYNGLTQVQYHYGLLENLLTMYYIF